MRIVSWQTLDEAGRRAALARPAQETRAEVAASVREIVAEVRRDGDAALRRYTERFDGARIERFAVTSSEFAAARAALDVAQIAALERAVDNVTTFHSAQLLAPLAVEVMPGVRCERIVRPIAAVGLYVPAGLAPLPSAVVMLAVPARLAGCPQRVLCTPPRRDGTADPGVLTAARPP